MRFSICFVWTVVYIYYSELFPTVVRSLALGFTSAIGTVGSFGAPYLVELCNYIGLPPMIVILIKILGFFNNKYFRGFTYNTLKRDL